MKGLTTYIGILSTGISEAEGLSQVKGWSDMGTMLLATKKEMIMN